MQTGMKLWEKWFSLAATRYALYGILFGLMFPFTGTTVETVRLGLSCTPHHWLMVHASNYLLWILDLVPATFGFVAWLTGKHEDRLTQTVTALEESKTLALEAADGGVWEWNVRTGEFSTTALLKSRWGYTDHEAFTSFADFLSRIHPDDRERVQQAVMAHVERRVPYHEQLRVRVKDGTYHWVDVRGQARWDAQGKPLKMNGAVRDIHEKRRLEEQVQETATILAASTTEIMATLTQLVASTTETAAAVTQTATTIEEVKQTAMIANLKAQEMSGVGQAAIQVSQTGERAVGEAANGLSHIREQMEVIAHSVIRLGEQSQTIGEIIATVNDLAEQSNLLAVNAAIEAANAGEHGKGFTVVAREVKRLAEQSKHATEQVRTILSDIQKASTSAVLVTEQGAKSVEVGVAQAMDAGGSIRTLAKSMVDAAQTMTQVAASSQQQLVGMDQVAQAISGIKTASSQNATGMHQIEGAVQQLDHLGQTLKTLIGEYTRTRANGTQSRVNR